MRRFHKHPAHPPPVQRYNAPIILLVTICVADRTLRLDNESAQEAMVAAWNVATHCRVGEYLIMPDHVHFFCVPGVFEFPAIRRWAGYWKRLVGRNQPVLKGAFMEDCWDTQMRDAGHYEEKLSYVRMNPVRKGLVWKWEDWPYRGRVFEVSWW